MVIDQRKEDGYHQLKSIEESLRNEKLEDIKYIGNKMGCILKNSLKEGIGRLNGCRVHKRLVWGRLYLINFTERSNMAK